MPAAPVGTFLAGLASDISGCDDERAPLVLLHGLTFDRTTWEPVCRELERLDPDRRVVALDLPGHGQSDALREHDLEQVAAAVHEAVAEAGIDAPVVVGHSISGVIATIYGARYRAAGVVVVDQTLRVRPFAQQLKSMAAGLRGPQFEAIWSQMVASMHAELLPPQARHLVESTMQPRRDIILSYQREILDGSIDDIEHRADLALGMLRTAGQPYLVIGGDSFNDEDHDWLLERLPHAAIETWPGTGHFPHLAHPKRFAERLAATAGWRAGQAD